MIGVGGTERAPGKMLLWLTLAVCVKFIHLPETALLSSWMMIRTDEPTEPPTHPPVPTDNNNIVVGGGCGAVSSLMRKWYVFIILIYRRASSFIL